MPFIEIKDLVFAYDEGGRKIFDGFNLNIEKGSYTAIIGHNGSGKSTLAWELKKDVILGDGKKIL